MTCLRSHSKVLTGNRSPTLLPKTNCPSPERQEEGRREKRNSQAENAATERRTRGGQELRLSQRPGSEQRRRLPPAVGGEVALRAFPGSVGVGRKESDYSREARGKRKKK